MPADDATGSRAAMLDVIGKTVIAWECGPGSSEFCNRPGTRREGCSCDCQNTTHAILSELEAAGFEIVPADLGEGGERE